MLHGNTGPVVYPAGFLYIFSGIKYITGGAVFPAQEWDAVVLSNYALEQQLHTARQELRHALYQHDAACQVIARLKERDEARELLLKAEREAPAAGTAPAFTPTMTNNGKRVPWIFNWLSRFKKVTWGTLKLLV